MNKQIKQLMQQAGTDTSGKWMNVDHAEEFTKLILQDIEKIVDELYHAMPLEQAAVLLTLDENIIEHFYGIKE